jgi:hypothetical protein
MDKSDKRLLGGMIIIGLALAYNFIWTKQYVKHTSGGAWNTINEPSSLVDSGFLSPVGTVAAPRMYTGMSQPSEGWEQGGGSSVTSSTGRWAA